MAFDFPSNPALSQEYTSNGVTYWWTSWGTWDKGSALLPVPTSLVPLTSVQGVSNTLRVFGTNFKTDDRIIENGTRELSTVFVSSTELTSNDYRPSYGNTETRINVTRSISPDLIIATPVDPRATIKSTFPDYFSDWLPDWDVEVWCNGLINTESVVYIDRVAQSTELKANVVGTEFMLLAHFDLTPYGDDTWVEIEVLNDGQHWSTNKWDFWIERIGTQVRLRAAPPKQDGS
jgi:hypothetical protein